MKFLFFAMLLFSSISVASTDFDRFKSTVFDKLAAANKIYIFHKEFLGIKKKIERPVNTWQSILYFETQITQSGYSPGYCLLYKVPSIPREGRADGIIKITTGKDEADCDDTLFSKSNHIYKNIRNVR